MAIHSVAHSYTLVSDTKSASGDNELVASPGASRLIAVKDIFVQNESEVETVAILKSGSSAQWRGKLAAGASMSLNFDVGSVWRLAKNQALNLNLSGANLHSFTVRYNTEIAE